MREQIGGAAGQLKALGSLCASLSWTCMTGQTDARPMRSIQKHSGWKLMQPRAVSTEQYVASALPDWSTSVRMGRRSITSNCVANRRSRNPLVQSRGACLFALADKLLELLVCLLRHARFSYANNRKWLELVARQHLQVVRYMLFVAQVLDMNLRHLQALQTNNVGVKHTANPKCSTQAKALDT